MPAVEFLRCGVLAVLLGLCPGGAARAGAHGHDAVQRPLDCAAGKIRLALPENGDLHIRTAAADAAFLELGEEGVQVEPVGRKPEVAIGVPLRFGVFLVALDAGAATDIAVHRTLPGRPHAEVVAQVLCMGSAAQRARLAWLHRVEAVAQTLRGSLDEARRGAVLESLRELREQANEPRQTALVAHLKAQAEYASGHAAAAIVAFREAERAWNGASDPGRAAIARIGIVEESLRAADYRQSLAEAARPLDRTVPSYVAARLQYGRCLALDYLGRLAGAEDCFAEVLKRLRALDERTEYLSVLQGLAATRRRAGKLAAAEQLLQQVVVEAEGQYAPVVRGRARLTLLELRLARADLRGALEQAGAALDDFTTAGDPRWLGNAWLKTATLFRELGAHGEAYAAVTQALRQFSIRDAPARVAASLRVLAAIDRATRRTHDAAHWVGVAERLYANLGMPEEREGARLELVALLLDDRDVGAATELLRDAGERHPANTAERRLVEARLALMQGKVSVVAENIRHLRKSSLDLDGEVTLARLDAQRWRAQGRGREADAVLRLALERLHGIATSSLSATLRALVLRKAAPLRQDGLRELLAGRVQADTPGSVPTMAEDMRIAAAAWDWLAWGRVFSPQPIAARPRATKLPEDFDATIAASLLGASMSPARSQRAHRNLVALFADVPAPDVLHEERLSLVDVQRALPDDVVLLAYLDGGDRAGLLLLDAHSARIVASAPELEVRESLAAIRASLRVPGTDQAQVREAAARLSDRLLGGLRRSVPPARLWVIADDLLDGVPWALLPWPGTDEAMIATTQTSLVRIAAAPVCGGSCPGPTVHVFAAEQGESASSVLQRLPNAIAEARAVAASLPERTVVVREGRAASATALLASLDQQNAWVHVAAHGSAVAGRIGYAGIWLDPPAAGASPRFLSWVDVLEQGVRADLVVLDACRLGEGSDAVEGSLGFASAVSQAGAHQVVASLWPVSDAASSLWVSTFYGAIGEDVRADAAAALRAAQLKLRESRMFRHPFHWAGLQVVQHLSITANPRRAGQSGQ